MIIALVVFATAIVALSIWAALVPHTLLELVRRVMAGGGIWAAVAVRAVLAVLLWLTAPVSRTPVVFQMLAILAILAAIGLPIFGAGRVAKLLDRIAAWPPATLRTWCILGVAFGSYILWAIYPALNGG